MRWLLIMENKEDIDLRFHYVKELFYEGLEKIDNEIKSRLKDVELRLKDVENEKIELIRVKKHNEKQLFEEQKKLNKIMTDQDKLNSDMTQEISRLQLAQRDYENKIKDTEQAYKEIDQNRKVAIDEAVISKKKWLNYENKLKYLENDFRDLDTKKRELEKFEKELKQKERQLNTKDQRQIDRQIELMGISDSLKLKEKKLKRQWSEEGVKI